MSPTIFREGPYRFYFFSREESRMHVHVGSSEGEAKFWMEPAIELEENHGIPWRELTVIEKAIRLHERQIRTEWQRHFGR
jgi:hypothetical protein